MIKRKKEKRKKKKLRSKSSGNSVYLYTQKSITSEKIEIVVVTFTTKLLLGQKEKPV